VAQLVKYKTGACFSCGRYLKESKPCDSCAIVPSEGVVECVVCTKILPEDEKQHYQALKNWSGSKQWKYLRRYCICTDCLQRAKNGEWKLKLKQPVTGEEPTPDWR